MYKILWIWEIVVDKTYFIPEFPEEWLKYSSTDSIEWVWWPVPTALKFLQNMWCEVELIWTVWDDYWSIFLKKELEKEKIKTNFIYDNSTKINTILVNNKNWQRTIIKDLDINNKIESIDIDLIKWADAIIFDRTEKNVFDFVIKNYRKETIIMVDPSTEFNDKILDFMKNSSKAIFPIETVNNMNKWNINNNLSALWMFLFNTKHNKDDIYKELIITDWWNWTYIYNWEKKELIPSLDIVPVDTNWAWDIFRWAYVWWLLQGWNTKRIVEFSNKIAWLQCLNKGNLIAVPILEDLK